MARTLVIGDVHEPVSHPGYLSFCADTYHYMQCDSVISIGDIVDWHAISFHCRHPNAPGPKDEYELAKEEIQKWNNIFPTMTVTIGNHDERVFRKAADAGIPEFMLRDYAEMWDTPGWNWVYDYMLDDVFYFHGTGRSGTNPSFNVAKEMGCSVVMGHVHSVGGIKWMCSPRDRRFGLDTGCGVDDKMFAFAYNKHNKKKSVLSCGVVIDGMGHHIMMPCSRGERYHRDRFPKNPLLER